MRGEFDCLFSILVLKRDIEGVLFTVVSIGSVVSYRQTKKVSLASEFCLFIDLFSLKNLFNLHHESYISILYRYFYVIFWFFPIFHTITNNNSSEFFIIKYVICSCYLEKKIIVKPVSFYFILAYIDGFMLYGG